MGLLDAPSERRRRKYRGWTQVWLYTFAAVNVLAALGGYRLRWPGGVLMLIEGGLVFSLTLQVFRSPRPWSWALLIVLIAPFVAQMLSLGAALTTPPPRADEARLDDTREWLDDLGTAILMLMGYGLLQLASVISFAASWAVGALGPPRSAVAEVFE